MKKQALKMILGMTILTGATALAAEVTNTPPWSAHNCNLGMNEWALLNAAHTAAGSRMMRFELTPSVAAAKAPQKSDGNVTEVFQIPGKAHLPADPADMIPGVRESKAQMAEALIPYQGKSVEFLFRAIQQNPLIRQCRVTIKPGHFMEMLTRFNFKHRQEKVEEFYTSEIPLLGALTLMDVPEFQYAKNDSSWDQAITESLYDLSEFAGDKGSFARQNVFYGTGDVIAYAKYPVRESIDESNFKSGVYMGASTVKHKGMALSYRVGMFIQKYPNSNKTISQMVPPEARRDILFDDSVINGLEIPFFGSSSMSTSESALPYQIGSSAREVSLKNSLESCAAGAKGQGFGQEFVIRLNRECGQNISMAALFIPGDYTRLSKMDWSNVTADALKGKQRKNETTAPDSAVSTVVSKKLFLAMSNHDTNVDALMKGELMVVERADLDLRLKKALSVLKRRALSSAEYQREFNRLSSFLPHLYFGLMANSAKGQNQRMGNEFRQFVLSGGLAYWLAFMDGNNQDTYAAQFSYRDADQRIGIVGLKSAKSVATDLVSSELGLDKNDVQKAVDAFSKAGLNCAAQYNKFTDLRKMVIPDVKTETRAQMKTMFADLANMYVQAESVSSGPCATAFHTEATRIHQATAAYIKKLKK